MVDCVLCRSSTEDSCDYGPSFHFDKHKKVHSNCLYTSSNLVQRGGVKNGISGFLKEDILAEVQRARKLTCFYCGENGASIGCCRKACRRSFHFSCGLENLACNQFCGSYKSYCHSHVVRTRSRPEADQNCVICLELLMPKEKKFSPVLMLAAPCCRNGWFHKRCIQKYANNAGYFFKCPLCNSSSRFLDLRLWGISVPNSDATWETEPNAFHDQLVRDVTCTVPDCIALDGPHSDLVNIISCQMCGSKPVHRYCVASTDTYVCETCSAVSPPADDSEDEFEFFADAPDARSRQERRDQNRKSYRDKLRAPSIDDGDDDEEDNWESIADQVKARCHTVQPQLANAPSSSLTAPAAATESPGASAAQPIEATGRSTETDGRTSAGSSGLSAATESATTGPRVQRSSTWTPYGLALRTRSRSSLPPLATAAPAAAADVRPSYISRRRELAAEFEAEVQQMGQRRLTRRTPHKEETETTPMSRELRRRRQSATRPRENVAPESRPANVSCVANRTRKRTAAKPKK